ncbi:Flagellar basal-body rod protein FlgF [wastewater metagenome]|uniref:Flagellar basal-body rod protein FlgF n=2 Tax=unclassified sequences TaxID=12908 RepID=A0A5B8RAE0_9ZZZZ|nr:MULTISPECIES: flagellar basal-body rod protein FlgF [Arhodomonas]MCS4502813.1 flagellar basal-body rod protein FlgF [Arhodomonas aquaeolei]QEA03705.1 flagellar basal-body rod protein FlgF [uncultured organism]
MDRMAYIAMAGAKYALEQQRVTSNNLANANTTGFRADLEALTSRDVHGPVRPSRVYGVETRTGSDFTEGALKTTGRDLDAAISGNGWFTVQAADGTEAYTRRGDFRVTQGGLLETGAGELVMGENGPVAIPPAEKVEIGQDGTISVVPKGQSANAMAVVDRLKLVDPPTRQLRKGEDGLFRLAGGGTADADAGVKVVSGALESSNVNATDALVQMIDHARRFESYIKMIETARQTDEAGQRLLRSGG